MVWITSLVAERSPPGRVQPQQDGGRTFFIRLLDGLLNEFDR